MVDGAAVKINVVRTPRANRGCCGTQAKAEAPQEPPPAGQQGRWMNLDDYLDGTYVPPEPTIGGDRDDYIKFLYPGRWHTSSDSPRQARPGGHCGTSKPCYRPVATSSTSTSRNHDQRAPSAG